MFDKLTNKQKKFIGILLIASGSLLLLGFILAEIVVIRDIIGI